MLIYMDCLQTAILYQAWENQYLCEETELYKFMAIELPWPRDTGYSDMGCFNRILPPATELELY